MSQFPPALIGIAEIHEAIAVTRPDDECLIFRDKRLTWAEVVALGQNVRAAEVGDRVLFSPDDRYEVEVGGNDYIMLRERDLHAVAASRIESNTGLYL